MNQTTLRISDRKNQVVNDVRSRASTNSIVKLAIESMIPSILIIENVGTIISYGFLYGMKRLSSKLSQNGNGRQIVGGGRIERMSVDEIKRINE